MVWDLKEEEVLGVACRARVDDRDSLKIDDR